MRSFIASSLAVALTLLLVPLSLWLGLMIYSNPHRTNGHGDYVPWPTYEVHSSE